MTRTHAIACALGALTDEQRRRRTVLAALLSEHASSIAEDATGYTIRLNMRDDVWLGVAELITLERRCCPFLSFTLTLSAEEETASLTLAGPAGAKTFIRDAFSLAV